VLFLAGVGTRSGYAFGHTVREGGALGLFAIGAVVTLTVALGALFVGHRLLRIPMGILMGMLADIQTQPAVLAFSVERTKNELPNTGYATAYPIATLTKIVVAQLIVGFFCGSRRGRSRALRRWRALRRLDLCAWHRPRLGSCAGPCPA
jgi:putative transport protein